MRFDIMENIPIDKLKISDLNVRKSVNTRCESFINLRESIRVSGVRKPLIVRFKNEKYEIIDGQRRFYACREIGLRTIPCDIQNISDKQAIELSLIDSIRDGASREDVNPIDIAVGLQKLCDENSFVKAKDTVVIEVARSIGLSRAMAWNYLSLLNTAPEVRNMVARREMSVFTASKLSPLPIDRQKETAKVIKEMPNDMADRTIREIKKSGKTAKEVSENIYSNKSVIFEVRTPDRALYTFRIPENKFAAIPKAAKSNNVIVADYLKGIIEDWILKELRA